MKTSTFCCRSISPRFFYPHLTEKGKKRKKPPLDDLRRFFQTSSCSNHLPEGYWGNFWYFFDISFIFHRYFFGIPLIFSAYLYGTSLGFLDNIFFVAPIIGSVGYWGNLESCQQGYRRVLYDCEMF